MNASTVVWLHQIWQTRNRQKVFCTLDHRRLLSQYLYRICRDRCVVLRMNSVRPEHIHLLLLMPPSVALNPLVASLQSALSTIWHSEIHGVESFSWSDEYAAFSVSPSQVDELLRYLSEQNQLHRNLSCAEEWQMLWKLHRCASC